MFLAQCARLIAFSAKRERKLKGAAVLHHKHPRGLISQSGRLRRAAAGGQWSHCPACLRRAPNLISRPYLSQILPAAPRPASGTIVTAWALLESPFMPAPSRQQDRARRVSSR